ncbi:MAG: hypothetical protein V3V76_01355, partial [Candidatus Adiutricales bacterium]
LEELKILVSGLEGSSMLLSDHISNCLNLTGELPGDKEELLNEIEETRIRRGSRFTRSLEVI